MASWKIYISIFNLFLLLTLIYFITIVDLIKYISQFDQEIFS